MGCYPSKCPGMTPRKDYAAVTTEVAPILPSTVNVNQEESPVNEAVQEMFMDRGDCTRVDKSDEEEPAAEVVVSGMFVRNNEEGSHSLEEILVRVPEEATVSLQRSSRSTSLRKSSRAVDDIPISSTYHRVHSAVVEEQETKRQEELRLEAEQYEREVREYKAAMQQTPFSQV